MGEPSPAMAKINRMNMAALQAYIERMVAEAKRLDQRVANLEALDEPPAEKIASLRDQRQRVAALAKAAAARLDEKAERKARYDARNR